MLEAVARRNVYEIEANYKLVGENFMEYYHLPWVHPELIKVSPVKRITAGRAPVCTWA